MDTLTNPARVLGLTGCLGDLGIINTPSTIISNWLFSNMSGSGWKFGPLLVKKVKDQHEVDVLGGKCLQPKH
jgi:hypothetical protein